MKVLVTGATGAIGAVAFNHCVAHPKITSVVALVRRPLPEELASNEKVETVIVQDFAHIPEDVLRQHGDAAAMLWMIGTYDTNVAANYEYPMAFHHDFLPVLESNTPRDAPFRFVCLGGHFVEADQNKTLFFLNDARKIKGRLQSESIQFAHDHKDVWKSFFPRPSAVILPTTPAGGIIHAILPQGMNVRVDELGAYMTYLAVTGDGGETTHNRDIVAKGRELLSAK